ncbi:hypothetical protein P3T76_004984 [Phytophthora citrophthora]|uniref:Secreted protein n=1 Tax=Phytophthora citrophthora TaxID=4793 RepID=A0AAD9GSR6_9STRA|nr:hypothetical protein P3T76_013327 [Phytophthora citrophthora]KAK1943588.1 hypothetical protein P3T76_004984 [Phytophthora citrophthora]
MVLKFLAQLLSRELLLLQAQLVCANTAEQDLAHLDVCVALQFGARSFTTGHEDAYSVDTLVATLDVLERVSESAILLGTPPAIESPDA